MLLMMLMMIMTMMHLRLRFLNFGGLRDEFCIKLFYILFCTRLN